MMNKNKFERVEDGNTYWTIADDSEGSARAFPEEENYCVADDKYFNNNNYFHSEELAKEVARKINFLLKLERLHDVFCPDYIPDWNDNSLKYCIRYNSEINIYTSGFYVSYSAETDVYFPSQEIAQQVTDILNREMMEK